MADTLVLRGSPEEQKIFTEVHSHYLLAKEDLEVRIKDFDKKDILFRSHIEKEKWPYRAIVFDPRTFTALYEKTARLLGNKPRGRLIPREGGDAIGAMVNNALLDFQWDDNERVDNLAMLAKWAIMDLNTRKYGASFGLAKWHYQTMISAKDKKRTVFFDGPNFKPLNNRDCLPNPSYTTIKNWFDHRDYLTLSELENINDAARGKPIYKNLHLLKDALQEEAKDSGGDRRSVNYQSKNLIIKGLTDFLGRDEYNKVVEVITEYRPERWITFSPRHGVILRDIPNPYHHGQIPIVMLRYYQIDEDLYGLSEIEPIEKLQRVANSLLAQYLDAINMSLYAPLKVKKTGGAVAMHTLEFGPGKKWLMDNPATDVITHDQQITGVSEFASTYRFIIGALQEGLGETSAAVSGLVPGESVKTATEITDLAMQRNARDNFNQIFLAEALKKQMTFWLKMNQQFLFSNPNEKNKIIRIVGKDALTYFSELGLDKSGLDDRAIDLLSNSANPEEINLQDLEQPLFPVPAETGQETKFLKQPGSQFGSLVIEPEDLAGTYDYIPDIESMRLPNEQQRIGAMRQAIELALNPATQQLLAQEQMKIKFSDLFEDYLELLGKKDADKYFEKIEGGGYGTIPGGAVSPQTGGAGVANGQFPSVQGSVPPMAGREAQPVIPGPV